MLSAFWKVGEHSDEIRAHWKSWEEVDNGLKSWERWNPNQKLKDCIICMNPALGTWEEMECIWGVFLRSSLEFRANLGLHLHHNLTIWGKYGVGLCM
jgi:hypothetical protein